MGSVYNHNKEDIIKTKLKKGFRKLCRNRLQKGQADLSCFSHIMYVYVYG